jgi:hypothetical protein
MKFYLRKTCLIFDKAVPISQLAFRSIFKHDYFVDNFKVNSTSAFLLNLTKKGLLILPIGVIPIRHPQDLMNLIKY